MDSGGLMYFSLPGICSQASSPASSPLGLSLDQSFIEAFIPTEEAQSTAAGEIVVNATATGGTPPYSFSWTLTRESDDDNAFSINMGTTDRVTWDDAVITTTYTGPPDFEQDPPGNLPPTPASYSIFCVVTDDNGDQEGAGMSIDVQAE